MATTQADLIKEFFINNPNRDISHGEAVAWLYKEHELRTGKPFADPDRGIRMLAQSGFLFKIKKGVYRYDPELARQIQLEDFTSALKQQIFERDEFRCVICGRGPKNGLDIHVDHIKPKDLGGRATLENGQTLCSEHNFRKKNYNQTESGKRMFIRLLNSARKENDQQMVAFCEAILRVYDEHGINGHIEWAK